MTHTIPPPSAGEHTYHQEEILNLGGEIKRAFTFNAISEHNDEQEAHWNKVKRKLCYGMRVRECV
jgi:hypothetical protein